MILDREFDGDYDAIVGAIRARAARTKAPRISGVPVFRSEANARTRREILLFVPLTVLTIAVLLVVVYRSLGAVVMAVGVGLIGTWLLAGAMGLAGVSISLITMILPSVILALGCSYVMHVLSAGVGARDPERLLEQLLPVAQPVALSGLTTAIGFAAIGAVRIEEVRAVGAFGGVGVLGIVAASLTVAPALLRALAASSRSRRGASAWPKAPCAGCWSGSRSRHRIFVMVASGLVLVAFAAGIGRLRVETDATRWFPHGSEVRESYESIRERLSGISPVNVVVESDSGVRVTEPAVVAALDGLSATWRACRTSARRSRWRTPCASSTADSTTTRPCRCRRAAR